MVAVKVVLTLAAHKILYWNVQSGQVRGVGVPLVPLENVGLLGSCTSLFIVGMERGLTHNSHVLWSTIHNSQDMKTT